LVIGFTYFILVIQIIIGNLSSRLLKLPKAQSVIHSMHTFLGNIAFSVIILEASMPCMTFLVLLAKRFGADDGKAMENFVVSTIFSILSLPVIIFLMQYINL